MSRPAPARDARTAGAGAGVAIAAFDDGHRALALLAQAFAGRPLRLDPIAVPAASPHLPPRGRTDDEVRVAIGDAPTEDRDLAHARRRIALLREVVRAGGPAPRLPEVARPTLLARVVATLERVRVDAVIGRRFPGARADLERLRSTALARRPAPVAAAPCRAALAALARASLGAPPADGRAAPDPAFSDALRAALADVSRPRARPADSVRAALALLAALGDATARSRRRPMLAIRAVAPWPGAAPGPAGLRATGRGDGGDGPTDAPGGDDAASGAGDDGAAGAPAAGAAAGGRALPVPAEAAARAADDAQDDDDPAPVPVARTARPEPAALLYDEWDHRQRRFLRAWCRVHLLRLRGAPLAPGEDARDRHPALAARIRQRFAQLRPTSRRRVRGVGDGDELDLEGIVAAVIDRRAGHADDERLYERRDPGERDVAAAFLVDMSASTATRLPPPDAPSVAPEAPPPSADTGALLYGLYDDAPEPAPGPPRRRVIDVEKDALALMSDALAALGDAHAIYGFTGQGRGRVEVHVAKEFDEPVSPVTRAALAAMEPRGSTRMGPAIRHAAARLARQPARLRLLVVVSDGYPQDVDYGPDRGDEEYGIQDTAHALREAERAGIETFCVTVDRAGHDYLRRMCAPRRYRVIEDVDALPEALGAMYADLTGRGRGRGG